MADLYIIVYGKFPTRRYPHRTCTHLRCTPYMHPSHSYRHTCTSIHILTEAQSSHHTRIPQETYIHAYIFFFIYISQIHTRKMMRHTLINKYIYITDTHTKDDESDRPKRSRGLNSFATVTFSRCPKTTR